MSETKVMEPYRPFVFVGRDLYEIPVGVDRESETMYLSDSEDKDAKAVWDIIKNGFDYWRYDGDLVEAANRIANSKEYHDAISFIDENDIRSFLDFYKYCEESNRGWYRKFIVSDNSINIALLHGICGYIDKRFFEWVISNWNEMTFDEQKHYGECVHMETYDVGYNILDFYRMVNNMD